MTNSLGHLSGSIPQPLRELIRAVDARFPNRFDIETGTPRDTGESAVTFVPRNTRGASVFCMYDGVAGDDSFYIWAGSILDAEFRDEADSQQTNASDWALKLIENIGEFGLFSILVKTSRGRPRRTDVFAPESQEEFDSISLGEYEVVNAYYEPW